MVPELVIGISNHTEACTLVSNPEFTIAVGNTPEGLVMYFIPPTEGVTELLKLIGLAKSKVPVFVRVPPARKDKTLALLMPAPRSSESVPALVKLVETVTVVEIT